MLIKYLENNEGNCWIITIFVHIMLNCNKLAHIILKNINNNKYVLLFREIFVLLHCCLT